MYIYICLYVVWPVPPVSESQSLKSRAFFDSSHFINLGKVSHLNWVLIIELV